MISEEMEANGVRFVLCQGTEPESQVSLLVTQRGAGVAHIAFAVDDVNRSVELLRDKGLSFDTTIIKGKGLTQAFSSRCKNTGLSFEFIQREDGDGFEEENIQELFQQLERSNRY
jgi:4-hydroxyphenylpyruvate dioxygenase-like putative hemolysin